MKHSHQQKIRIGVLLDSWEIDAWAYSMLEQLRKSEYADIVLYVMNKTTVSDDNAIKRLFRNRHLFLYRLYMRFEKKFNMLKPDAFELMNWYKNIDASSIIEVTPKKTRFSDRLSSQDIEVIKQHDVDILIRLGFRILRGDVLNVARYGIWSFHHGDNKINRGGPPGFWEVMKGEPLCGSILQILSSDLDSGTVLARSWSATDPCSVLANCNNFFWKSSSMLPVVVKRLYIQGEEKFFKDISCKNAQIPFYDQPLYHEPDNGQFMAVFPGFLFRTIKWKIVDKFYREQWLLFFRIGKNRFSSFWRYKPMLPPKDRFWADPFAVFRNGKYFIFIEEYIQSMGKGVISLIEMEKNGSYTTPRIVLERPYHMSYPFLLEYKDELYMIPETFSNKTIETYKCVHFPDKWELHKTLMQDVIAVDATLHFYNKKWWMFVNMQSVEGSNFSDELFLFYADTPFSDDYRSHPENPIISSAAGSRPAGRIYEHNGETFRMSQITTREGYGVGMQVNQIIEWNTEHYREKVVHRLHPHWLKKLKGLHTYNQCADLHLLDAKINRPKWNFGRYKLK
ncbi:hypothetical protein KAR48_08810 [bacterium]|nr:hypothetical protein [bacterium]